MPPNNTQITEETNVTLKSVIGIVSLAIVLTVAYCDIKGDLTQIKKSQYDAWTRLDQREWAQELKNLNGSKIEVPAVTRDNVNISRR